MIVIGIDQSLAQPGLAAVERVRGTWRLREALSFATVGDSDATTSLDDARRVREMVRDVQAFLVRHAGSERVVAVELLSGRARSHRADRTMSLAYGAIVTLCSLHGITPQFVSAHEAKKAATGNAMAEKPDVVAAMVNRWGWVPEAAAKGETDRVRRETEAKADALAIATVIVDRVNGLVASRRAA